MTKTQRRRNCKRADFAPPEEESASRWQKPKQNAVAKVKAKLGGNEYVRILVQYTTAKAVSSFMGNGVITAVMAMEKLLDMELLSPRC